MKLHYRIVWLTFSWLWLLAIINLSLITIPKSVEFAIPHLDKVEHTFSYFVLMFLFSQCYRLNKTRAVYAVIFICLGIMLEILQSFTITRQFEYADMVANSSGVILGLILGDSYLQKIVIFIDEKIKTI